MNASRTARERVRAELTREITETARQQLATEGAAALSERGFDLVSGGTDNHLILVDLRPKDLPGKPAAQALDRARITTNYNMVPFDPRKPFDPSGIRIGTPAVTTRGMKEPEMETIAGWIDAGVDAAKREDDEALARLGAEVRELALQFPIPGL